MEIANVGYFGEDKSHNLIEIPSKMIKMLGYNDAKYFNLDCSEIICPTTSVRTSTESECANSIFTNLTTKHCKILRSDDLNICNIIVVKGLGTLCSTTNADFFPEPSQTHLPFKQKVFKKRNTILVDNGHLICKDSNHSHLETRYISEPNLGSTKIGYIHRELHLKDFTFEDSNSALSVSVHELQDLNHNLKLDYIQKSGFSLLSLVVLMFCAFVLLQIIILGLGLYYCYRRNKSFIDKRVYQIFRDYIDENFKNLVESN